jgi:hypothetical protein
MMGKPPKTQTTGKERQGAPEEQRQENAKKAKEAAERLYPREKWEPLEAGIFISKTRMPRSVEQIKVLEKELKQAIILVERGSTVCLLPEAANPNEKHVKYPDAVVDGHIMEFKTISGIVILLA